MLARWIGLWDRREAPDALALVRIGVAFVILWDFASVASLGLVEPLWATIEAGGMGPATQAEPLSEVYRWFGGSRISTWSIFALACSSALGLLIGFRTRTSALVLALAWAQLAHLSPDTDRGIDVLLRNVLLILACSAAGATLSLDARLRHGRWRPDLLCPAWPRYFIVLQLVLMYFWAGVLKQSPPWTSLGGYSALYIVLSQPHYAAYDLSPATLARLYPLLQLATLGTAWFERLAPALPLLLWLRATSARSGKLRSWLNRARLLELWVVSGVGFHLGLALCVRLGMFPWGCLALYPALASPSALRRAGRMCLPNAAGVVSRDVLPG